MKKYIFDLDNTLVYTNKLNNIAYNYALKKYGFKKINSNNRITREIIIKSDNKFQKNELENIIKTKQEYFLKNIKQTKLNKKLFEILVSKKKENCVLWTAAEKIRVISILKFYKLENLFHFILFSNKTNLKKDINILLEKLECELKDLNFYEDELCIINELKTMKLNILNFKK